jgi:hypothetical protein
METWGVMLMIVTNPLEERIGRISDKLPDWIGLISERLGSITACSYTERSVSDIWKRSSRRGFASEKRIRTPRIGGVE